MCRDRQGNERDPDGDAAASQARTATIPPRDAELSNFV